jgi:hypothetical protein
MEMNLRVAYYAGEFLVRLGDHRLLAGVSYVGQEIPTRVNVKTHIF